MKLEVNVPDENMGDVIRDLNSRHGCVDTLASRGALPLLRPVSAGIRGADPDDEHRLAPGVAPVKPTPGDRAAGIAFPEPDPE